MYAPDPMTSKHAASTRFEDLDYWLPQPFSATGGNYKDLMLSESVTPRPLTVFFLLESSCGYPSIRGQYNNRQTPYAALADVVADREWIQETFKDVPFLPLAVYLGQYKNDVDSGQQLLFLKFLGVC